MMRPIHASNITNIIDKDTHNNTIAGHAVTITVITMFIFR